MTVGRICVRSTVVAKPEESVRRGAERMVGSEVGTLVVIDQADRPVGIVTDRDVMARCVVEPRDPDQTRLSEIMSHPVLTVRESTPIEDAVAQMSRRRIRRLPVLADGGERLVGILALDDVLQLLADEEASVRKLLESQSGPDDPQG